MRRFFSKLIVVFLFAVVFASGTLAVEPTLPSPITNSSAADTNASAPLGQLPTPAAPQSVSLNAAERLKKYQARLDMGREQRAQKNTVLANATLSELVKDDAPVEIQRQAMFELALLAQDDGKLLRAEQIFSQYQQAFPDDPTTPEIMLRQGLIYRQMGVNSMAISKFYAVMYSALKLKLENMDYYKNIVLQSQVEIADTYYMDGKYDEAADFLTRLIKASSPFLNMPQTHYKLVRSLSYSTNTIETVAQSQIYLSLYSDTGDVPEVRFLLASALKKLGRNNDSMKQVLLLLQSQQDIARKNPEVWKYWQQRAGNEIAAQLYKEGDFVNALQIYLSLADLDNSPAWQMPVWYQTALVYEQLQQWQKASALYVKIAGRRNELIDSVATPTLLSLLDMSKWRKDYIDWMQKAKVTQQSFVLNQFTNSTPATNP